MPTILNEEREEWTVYQHQQQMWGVITVTQSEIPGIHLHFSHNCLKVTSM